MARVLTRASGHYMEGAAAVTTTPVSFACWFKTGNTANFKGLIGQQTLATMNYFQLYCEGILYAETAQNGSAANAASAGFTPNVWQHAAAVFAASNSRSVYLNGGGKVTNTTSLTPTGIDTTGVGAGYYGGGRDGDNFDGSIAEMGVWNVALTDDDVAALGKGVSPLLVRPDGLQAYWPFYGRDSPEIDLCGRIPLTVSGAVAGEHVRIFYPSEAWPEDYAAGAAPPAFMARHGILIGQSVPRASSW